MKVAFCGHSQVEDRTIVKKEVLSLLQTLPNEHISFLLGGYGDFDCICLECCKVYKDTTNGDSELCFVTPYLSEKQLKNKLLYIQDCDTIIYPEIENVPKKFAISQRNKWMVRECDILICYTDHKWGGAYRTYSYAMRVAPSKVKNLRNVR